VTEFPRTDDSYFAALEDWPHEPRYHQWKDVRVHCEAGYRCIADTLPQPHRRRWDGNL